MRLFYSKYLLDNYSMFNGRLQGVSVIVYTPEKIVIYTNKIVHLTNKMRLKFVKFHLSIYFWIVSID